MGRRNISRGSKPMVSKKKNAEPVNVDELEARVRLAELRAREVEAEIRLVAAMAKRRELKTIRKARKETKAEQDKASPKKG
jgi:hypothetical protein